MQASTPCKSSRAAVMTRQKAVRACEILLSSYVSESHSGTCRSMPPKDWELGTKNSTEAGVLARDRSHAPAGAFGLTRPSNTYRSLSVGWKNPHRQATECELLFKRTLLADCVSTRPAREEFVFWLQIIKPHKRQHTQAESDCGIWCCLWRDRRLTGGKEADLIGRPSRCQKRPEAREFERDELFRWLQHKEKASSEVPFGRRSRQSYKSKTRTVDQSDFLWE